MNFQTNKITGFSCSDSKIFVTNQNGKGLYFMENPKGKKITFNVPKGNWKTENDLSELEKPLKFICPPLPPKTVNREMKKFVFRVGDNPNKCTIDFSGKDADVFIDREIDSQEIPHFVFVMFHENGHFRYGGKKHGTKEYFDDEHFCDVYASTKMLELGFNPSQCIFAIEMCLSEEDSARDRKDRLFSFLKKVKVL